MIGSLVSGGAAIFGLFLATVVAWTAFRLFQVESMRDLRTEKYQRRQDAERRRSQAAQVGFWHDDEKFYFANHSALPVYFVAVLFAPEMVPSPEDGSFTNQVDLDEKNWAKQKLLNRFRERKQMVAPLEVLDMARMDSSIDPINYCIGFIDNAGNGWLRSMYGDLHEYDAARLRSRAWNPKAEELMQLRNQTAEAVIRNIR